MPTPVPQGLVPKTTDFADRIRANFKTQSAMTTFGIEMLDVVAGHTRLEMLANDRVLQQQGFVHGGVIAAAMDSACGYAALSLAAADREVLTIEYKVSFIAPAIGERYEFEGQVIKLGPHHQLYRGDGICNQWRGAQTGRHAERIHGDCCRAGCVTPDE